MNGFALDHRLWPLDPVRYLMTDLLILLAEIVVVYLLTRCWLTICWAPLLAPSGPRPPTPGVIQADLVPLPSPVLQRPVLQQQRNSC